MQYEQLCLILRPVVDMAAFSLSFVYLLKQRNILKYSFVTFRKVATIVQAQPGSKLLHIWWLSQFYFSKLILLKFLAM